MAMIRKSAARDAAPTRRAPREEEPVRRTRQEDARIKAMPRRFREEEPVRRTRIRQEDAPVRGRQSREDFAPTKQTRRAAREPERAAPKQTRTPRAEESVTGHLRPIREKMTVVEKIDWIVDHVSNATSNQMDRKTAKAFLTAYHELILAHIMPKGIGEFSDAGMFKVVRRERPSRVQEAIKPGTVMTNKFNGETYKHDGRPRKVLPKTWKAKLLPQRLVKAAVLGE